LNGWKPDPNFLKQVKNLLKGRNHIKARNIIHMLGMEIDRSNTTIAGMTLKYLGWKKPKTKRRKNHRTTWMKPGFELEG